MDWLRGPYRLCGALRIRVWRKISVPVSTDRADLPFAPFAPLLIFSEAQETYLTGAGFPSSQVVVLMKMFFQQQLLPDATCPDPEEHRTWSRLDRCKTLETENDALVSVSRGP